MVDESAAAAAEVVWDFLIFLEAKIDVKIATYILAGIYYDTGGFFHSNVTDKTLKISAECMRLGGRMGFISQHISSSKSFAALKLWGLALKRMEVSEIGVASTFLTYEDLTRYGAQSEDASGIVNLINTVPSAKVAILFLELPDGKIKASLRTEENIDVSKLARVFCGGGHKKAAGFSIDGKIVHSKLGWKIEFAD
jgi:phosphoesterase RecJ-like protein